MNWLKRGGGSILIEVVVFVAAIFTLVGIVKLLATLII